jgi:hypothetical protein
MEKTAQPATMVGSTLFVNLVTSLESAVEKVLRTLKCELEMEFKYDPRKHTKNYEEDEVRVVSCDFVDRSLNLGERQLWLVPGRPVVIDLDRSREYRQISPEAPDSYVV